MGLSRYLIRRVIFLIFIMFGVTLLMFTLANLIPSDPVLANLSQANMNNEELECYIIPESFDSWLPDRGKLINILDKFNIGHGDIDKYVVLKI